MLSRPGRVPHVAAGPRAERTRPAWRAYLPALPPAPLRGLRGFQRKITLRQRADCRPPSLLGTSFQSCGRDEPRCKGAPEAAQPVSSTDRQDLGRAGPLTPVIQVCCLGGSGTPSVPIHIHAEAVTKPEQRHAQPPAPRLLWAGLSWGERCSSSSYLSWGLGLLPCNDMRSKSSSLRGERNNE